MGKERPERDNHRFAMRETIDGLVWQVEHGLERVLRAGLFLKMEKVGREGAAGGFHLDERPRGSVAAESWSGAAGGSGRRISPTLKGCWW